ncbi:hypothetical protein HDU99_003148, partial [Rhizoclosmatium hyalinum]
MSIWSKRPPIDSTDLEQDTERVANLLAAISDVPIVASEWIRRMELDDSVAIDIHEKSCTDQD